MVSFVTALVKGLKIFVNHFTASFESVQPRELIAIFVSYISFYSHQLLCWCLALKTKVDEIAQPMKLTASMIVTKSRFPGWVLKRRLSLIFTMTFASETMLIRTSFSSKLYTFSERISYSARTLIKRLNQRRIISRCVVFARLSSNALLYAVSN